MNKFIVLTCLILIVGCKPKTQSRPQYRDISVGMAHNLILQQQGNHSFTILDVRTPEEFATGHIDGAINIDYINNKEELLNLPKDKTYLIYCASGNRSRKSALYLKSQGHSSLFNMSGGIKSWVETFNTYVPSPLNER